MAREHIKINMDSIKTRKDWKRFKIEDGSNIFRILPPAGEAEVHKGYPYRRWSTVWFIDPATGKNRPFASPQTEGKDCPVKEYNDLLVKRIKEVEANLLQKGLDDDQINEKMAGLRNAQWKIKVNNSYLYNAANKEGELGLLELKSTAHKGVKKLMMDYITEYNQDPTSLNSDHQNDSGVWLNISKTGKNKETEYAVSFAQVREKSTDGKVYKVDDRSPLSDNIVESYEDLAYDLNAVYARKTYDELKEILLFNLALWSKEFPEVVLPGYEEANGLTTKSSESKAKASLDDDDTPVPSKKKVVQIKLDDNDDEFDDEPAPAKVAPKVKNKTAFDAMAMAKDILGE